MIPAVTAGETGARRQEPGPSREVLAAPVAAPHPLLERYYADHAARPGFVTDLFDAAAPYYDWVCRVMALGSGQFYRRQALLRAGLLPGMRLLDIATGTGLVARAAERVLGASGSVVGFDASTGMLRQASRRIAAPLVQGWAETLPFQRASFDFASIGYALRHMADLGITFAECLRVLKPGGRLLILEISRPRSPAARWAAQAYLERILPVVARIGTGSRSAELLTKYHWDTIAECVAPETIVALLSASGFAAVERRVLAGIISEYAATKPSVT